MEQTENKIIKIAKQIMEDIGRKYYTDIPFNVNYSENSKNLYSNEIIQKCWTVKIYVHDDQWNKEDDPGIILIQFDEDKISPVFYGDASMGRPVPLSVRKNSAGKYELCAPQK